MLAAGLSSRMGAFKPLMQIGGKTLVEHSVGSLFQGGAQSVTVVLGCRAAEVRAVLKKAFSACEVSFAYNPGYAKTDMLASIKAGLCSFAPCDAFFLLPGDMPAVARGTMRALLESLEQSGAAVAMPMVEGRRKHPPLIRASCINDILTYEGEGGLRGIWRSYEDTMVEVPVSDRGCLLDADKMNDFLELSHYLQNKMHAAEVRLHAEPN